MDKILYKSLHFSKLSQKETKNIKISISIVLFSLITLFVLDAYAQQQGGSATSGDATGGAANAGGIMCVEGAYCTIYNHPQATGGAATSGAATGGAATAEETTSIPTLVDQGDNQEDYADNTDTNSFPGETASPNNWAPASVAPGTAAVAPDDFLPLNRVGPNACSGDLRCELLGNAIGPSGEILDQSIDSNDP